MAVQLVLAVKQSHEKGICHGECGISERRLICIDSIQMAVLHLCPFVLSQ